VVFEGVARRAQADRTCGRVVAEIVIRLSTNSALACQAVNFGKHEAPATTRIGPELAQAKSIGAQVPLAGFNRERVAAAAKGGDRGNDEPWRGG